MLEKSLSKEKLTEYFEEQRAVFSSTIEEGDKYRPLAEYFGFGQRMASVRFPELRDADHMAICFDQIAWFPKLVKATESILYLDASAEVVHKETGETKDSDVFLGIKTSTRFLDFNAAPYWMMPDVKHPVWDQDFEMREEGVYSLSDVIAALNFGMTVRDHNFSVDVMLQYWEDNGFEVEFYHPFHPAVYNVMDGHTLVG